MKGREDIFGSKFFIAKNSMHIMVAVTEVRKAHIKLDGANHGVEEYQRVQSSDKYLSMGILVR